MVWGRARFAVDAADDDDKTNKSSAAAAAKAPGGGARNADERGAGGNSGVTFDEYYRAAMVDAHGDDLDALRKGHASGRGSAAAAADRTDVGIIMRAIQAGVDVVPALQKELVLQFASLDELRELKSGGRGGGGGGVDGDSSDSDSDSDEEEMDLDAEGGSDSSDSDGSDSDDEDDSEKEDAVDYENTEFERSSGSDTDE